MISAHTGASTGYWDYRLPFTSMPVTETGLSLLSPPWTTFTVHWTNTNILPIIFTKSLINTSLPLEHLWQLTRKNTLPSLTGHKGEFPAPSGSRSLRFPDSIHTSRIFPSDIVNGGAALATCLWFYLPTVHRWGTEKTTAISDSDISLDTHADLRLLNINIR